jgi:hypothetical protein
VANIFLNIPVPAADGSGAAVNCATQGSLRTIVVGVTPGPSGEGMRCTLNIQISNAAAAPVNDNEWAPLATFQQDFGADQTVIVAAKWVRVMRSNSRFPSGTPSVTIGSTDDGTTIANLPTTAGNGTGAPVNAAALPPWKTVTVGGAFNGNVNVLISEDGVFFAPVFSFLGNGGQQSAAFMAQFMSVERDGVPTINPGQPIVNVGAAAMAGGGGGGGGGGGLQFFVVAGVVGQSSYAVTLPSARVDALYEVIPAVNAPGTNDIKSITVDPTTITNVGFTAVLSAGAEAGDLLVFFVHDV